MKRLDEFKFFCVGYGDFNISIVIEEFFSILEKSELKLVPKKIGLAERKNILFSVPNANGLWERSIKEMGFYTITFANELFNGSLDYSKNKLKISLWIRTKVILDLNNLEKFKKMARELFLWSNSIYGYACHIGNLGGLPSGGLTYETCLGNISWMTLFGPPYVDMFGRNIIETVPCQVEEFAVDRFMLLTSDFPMEKNDAILGVQANVMMHLGKDAFDRKDKRTAHISKEGYRSPDLSEYKIKR